MPQLRAIDFFCGGGGMTYGLRKAGIQVIAGVDIDKDCKETYITNNPDSVFIQSDINTLKFCDLEKKLKIKKNDDNLFLNKKFHPIKKSWRLKTTPPKYRSSKFSIYELLF